MKNKEKISRNIVVLGLVSFFNDFSSEMVYPIIPIFLVSLGVPIAIIGLIEGIAESTASLLKVFSGWFSDRVQKRKVFVGFGYLFSSLSKIIMGVSQGWPLFLCGRVIDRIGKGVRTSPRDALIAESSLQEYRGKSFGLHRAMDTMGAVIGPLAALTLIGYFGDNLRPIFYLAFIPGIIGVFLLLLFVTEKTVEHKIISPKFVFPVARSPFFVFLCISALFALGNSSNAFLILKAKNLGLSTMLIIFVYVVYNIVYALFSTYAGMVSDKIGPKKVLLFGFFLFALIYFLFALNTSVLGVWLLFAAYGFYMALTDGVSSAYVSSLVVNKMLATTFGLYQTTIGVCTFFSSIIAGLLWTHVSPNAPFFFGACLALIAALLFLVVQWKQ